MIIVLMGVAGSGKTTIGKLLSQQLGWPFFDGDDFHPPANVAKMRAGIPLTDADRAGWLDALRKLIAEYNQQNRSSVVACSALKQTYREHLGDVRVVYLKGSRELLQTRLSERKGHFFHAELLESQLHTLEEPRDAITVDASHAPGVLVAEIRQALAL
jgi:gluconokinase